MNVFSIERLSHQRSMRTDCDWDVACSCHIENVKRVIADLLEIDISINAGNSEYFDTRMTGSKEECECVIYSSIDIKDYFEHWTITFS